VSEVSREIESVKFAFRAFFYIGITFKNVKEQAVSKNNPDLLLRAFAGS
jgi:hypothetical protein